MLALSAEAAQTHVRPEQSKLRENSSQIIQGPVRKAGPFSMPEIVPHSEIV